MNKNNSKIKKRILSEGGVLVKKGKGTKIGDILNQVDKKNGKKQK